MSGGCDIAVACMIDEILAVAAIEPDSDADWACRLVDLEPEELAAIFYLVDHCRYGLESAMDGMDEVRLRQAPMDEVAQEIFDDCYLPLIPESVQSYVDYEQFAYDCRISGMLREFHFGGNVWTCTSGH